MIFRANYCNQSVKTEALFFLQIFYFKQSISWWNKMKERKKACKTALYGKIKERTERLRVNG